MPVFKNVPLVNVQQFTCGNKKEVTEFIDVFGAGIKEFGFVVVEGHGISPQLIDNAYASVKSFFALSEKQKRNFEVSGGGGQRGYTGFGKEHAKNSSKGDLKEFWHVGREHYQGSQRLYPENVWPEIKNQESSPNENPPELQGFKPTLLDLYGQLDTFAGTLLRALSLYLALPEKTLPQMIADGNSILRCIHYPPVDEKQFETTGLGAVRAAAHEDINFITILCEATESGLELLGRDGKWLPVNSGKGQMVVDSGDMLSRICNNYIPSTTHRVVNPPTARNVARFSMPFFVHPHKNCNLEVLPTCTSSLNPPLYPPIIADEFLHQRLKEIGLIKNN